MNEGSAFKYSGVEKEEAKLASMVSGGSTLSKVEHLPAPDHLHWLYFNTYCFYTRAGCGYTGLRVDKSVFTNDSIDCPANHP